MKEHITASLLFLQPLKAAELFVNVWESAWELEYDMRASPCLYASEAVLNITITGIFPMT